MKVLNIEYGSEGVYAALSYDNLGHNQGCQEIGFLPGLKVTPSIESPYDCLEAVRELCGAMVYAKPALAPIVRSILSEKQDAEWRIVNVELRNGFMRLVLANRKGEQTDCTVDGGDLRRIPRLYLRFEGQRDFLGITLQENHIRCTYDGVGISETVSLQRPAKRENYVWLLTSQSTAYW